MSLLMMLLLTFVGAYPRSQMSSFNIEYICFEDRRPCTCTFQDDVEEEENHGDAFHKFRAIEKKAVKAIFS